MFYNDRIILAEKSKQGLYMIRKIKNEILMQYYKIGSEEVIQKVILDDAIGEFDIDFDNDDLYIIYKNNKRELVLLNLNNKDISQSKIAEELIGGIYELNLINIEDSNSIIYIEEVSGESLSYNIKHIFIENNNIENFIVDKIKTYNFISPIKIIRNNNNIIVAYYYQNQICVKEFNTKIRIWSSSTTLTNNKNKLYLDLIKKDNYFHLAYSDFHDENFSIKYERFLIDNDYITKDVELNISDYGNNTDPILIYYLDQLWIVWRETNQLLSKFSEDGGKTFSDIYLWKESKSFDMVKYKYKTNIIDNNAIIDNSYGSIYPDIRFIGFGERVNR